jgi:hypothetical protein
MIPTPCIPKCKKIGSLVGVKAYYKLVTLGKKKMMYN